jgi:hypothetical protein
VIYFSNERYKKKGVQQMGAKRMMGVVFSEELNESLLSLIDISILRKTFTFTLTP